MQIAKILCLSVRTVRRRMSEYGICIRSTYTDEELDTICGLESGGYFQIIARAVNPVAIAAVLSSSPRASMTMSSRYTIDNGAEELRSGCKSATRLARQEVKGQRCLHAVTARFEVQTSNG